MTLLEDRLAAAGDQLDHLIDTRVGRAPHHSERLGEQARHRRALTVAASTVALVAGGLWLMSTGRGPAEPPVAEDIPTTVAPAPTATAAIEPGASACGIDQSQLVLVASATDSQGRTIDYLVADLPDANEEQLRFSDGGWSSACDDDIPLSALHPSGAWTNVAMETSAVASEVYVHGKLPAGSGPHEVTLSTGDVVPVTPTAAGWFLATAVLEPVDDVEDVATTPVSAPSTVAPTSIPVMAEPVADAAPLAIGESVMLGAAQQLQAGGFVVNASESRQGDDVVDVLRQLAAAGQIGETVVLQVGTNGPVAAETYLAIVTVLTDVDRVVFLTVHAPGKGWIEENNAHIWGLLQDHPNVDVLDWDGLAASEQVPGMAGDGIHLGTAAAQQFYANYVFGIIGRNDLIRPLPE